MHKFILKRIFSMIVAMFMIALLTFSMMHSVPGGPFTRDRKLPPEVEIALNEKYNLDAPLHEQFFSYIADAIKGDLGPSFRYTGKTVNDFIESGFPTSAKLGVITIIFVLITAIPMGILAAVKSGKWQDMFIMAVATIGVTIPSFIIASMLIYVFSFQLNWLPTYGVDKWSGYILPTIALGGYSVSYIARLMRSSLLEVMGQDYIRTARSKGLSDIKVITKHALRNALVPIVTVLGPTVAGLLTGSFVIEKIFALPGLGMHFVNGVAERDYTTIMGVTLFYAAFLLAMVLVVDIFYVLIDPRIKFDN
ncbi:peptide ABC transporter permease [Candidatus Epulonipiscium fishelsonii]|uniref:Peptide ABC transporter permease n=1 Tax=Candidatus Epulonipiscium fishelsonii TaxID=77094 RepID=A0ACC8XB11_9FIRM|nr:peptide ABC transporter permease [Epulopiscium sp. SCG-B11WGA-EpuloA1]